MFEKVLIANRGEIAVRIIRACKELGIKTVAVYSEPDENCLHVGLADEAICIGPGPSKASYLNIPAIISAAEIADVEAIHPGYGFLAEDCHFAEICQSCKIEFIGPSPESIKLMGDKLQARNIARKAGVPVIPGSDGPVLDKDHALKIAEKIGYPVVIKAVGGGGGKGMRICHNDVRLVSAFITAQREAEEAFGNKELYIEKFIPNARHIEVQILSDKYGNAIHLGERDCTVQRRFQKLIEETPSPVVNNKLRKRLGETALKLVKAINYFSAGTVEFIVDDQGKFYFLEMNTRIQVEHPVTELVTGIDLVQEQIKIASGEKLSRRQSDVNMKGWAMECRINAEDPDNGFMPLPGKVDILYIPGGPGIRVDTHLYSGYSIPPYYDSLVAKLIAYGEDRIEVLQRMTRALDEFILKPLKTTIPFLRRVITDEHFQTGNYYTDFVDRLLGREEK
ncbi:MAG: acetyl-CoA carboxylase biotin carboxylase subunit [Candidatus Omnitrophota bacterium]|nr:MAG: acetyl-CoA carboxylase biotin carboxylase subunit [Candidatus Omnitrophota bacterium]